MSLTTCALRTENGEMPGVGIHGPDMSVPMSLSTTTNNKGKTP